ncbi:hypothetical protein F2Q70_00027574 [Brassica cretica]|uniref:Clp1 N-terminal domain-containing protein n=1 Tax=Brassica cretica TaxID=69181 RepID=A0A8S9LGS4_BRACR|nr:hypothetical protein F2Q70_00027574 [Brassica cretica]
MSYCGLSMNSDATTASTEFSPQVRRVKLEKQSEIRIHVTQISPLKLRILHGQVEIFGSELPRNVWLTFPPLQQFAVFTWYGATLEIDGVTETDNTSVECAQLSTSTKTSGYVLNKRLCFFTGAFIIPY